MNIALISAEDPGHPLIAINLSLADIFIGMLLLLWALKLFKGRTPIKLAPLPVLIFVGIGLFSFVNAYSISEWAKEAVQMVEYFILFYMAFINNLSTVSLSAFKNTLLLSSSINLIIASVQYMIPDSDAYLIRGLFENHNILGTFLCIVIPIIYIELIYSIRIVRKIWMALLLILSIIVLTSGSAILSALAGLCVVSWRSEKKIFVRFLVIVVITATLYPFVLPSKNVKAVKEFSSGYEQGSISKNYYRRLSLLGDLGEMTLLSKEMSGNYLRIKTRSFFTVKLLESVKGEAYTDMETGKHIKNQYLEMQASLNMLSEHSLTGVGAGNFQKLISNYYKGFPKINTAEPNQHNSYLIIGSTLGILGLAAFFWLIFFHIQMSFSGTTNVSRDTGYMSLAITGSLTSCLVNCFFSWIFHSGICVVFVSMLAFACMIKNINKN